MNSNHSNWPSETQASTLRNSIVRLIPACERVSEQFYSRLFESHPELRPMFPEDMSNQQEKLILMLASSIDLLKDQDKFETTCAALGRRHVGYGAKAEHYPIVASLVLEEIGRQANPPLSAEEQESWALLFQLIGTSMLSGANQKD